MNQPELKFSRPSPDDLFKSGSQCHTLYSRLLKGTTDNGEILFSLRIGNHTGRISDLRKKLKPYCMDVRATPDAGERSKVYYQLVG